MSDGYYLGNWRLTPAAWYSGSQRFSAGPSVFSWDSDSGELGSRLQGCRLSCVLYPSLRR